MHGSRFEIRDPESTGSRILNLGGVSASACALCGCESARLKVVGPVFFFFETGHMFYFPVMQAFSPKFSIHVQLY